MASAMTPKERIYAILRGEPIDRLAVTPIFMAWSAHFIGRTYRDYYLDADVLAASQQAVTQAFHLDQISAISDPWREASAYGMEFEYPPEGVGKPKESLIRDPDDVARVTSFEIEKAERPRQRVESVATMAAAVGPTHSVLGWVEGPIAEYADLRGVENTFMDLIDKPDMYFQAATVIVDNAIRFARAQIDAGADMIGVGDAVASLINPAMYEQFVLPFEKTLIDAIHEAGGTVKLHICGNNPDCPGYELETGSFRLKGYEGPVIECDKCGSEMQLKSGRFGKYFGCTNDQCKNTRKLLRNGQPAPPKIDPVAMPELRCDKVDDHYVLRDGASGLFLAASKFPKHRETRAPLVVELIPHRDELDPKYHYLLDAPTKDPDGNLAVVRYSRKSGEQYVQTEVEGKPTGWKAFYTKGRWQVAGK